ncbi:MAG: hypothetical protein JXB05_16590 [Myxococcaceae bacterium]|nr:hypothetical protein [Myxococcaceae bacterium]
MVTIAPPGSQSDLPRLFAYLASESATNTTELRLQVDDEMQSWRTEAGEYQMVEGALPPDNVSLPGGTASRAAAPSHAPRAAPMAAADFELTT